MMSQMKFESEQQLNKMVWSKENRDFALNGSKTFNETWLVSALRLRTTISSTEFSSFRDLIFAEEYMAVGIVDNRDSSQIEFYNTEKSKVVLVIPEVKANCKFCYGRRLFLIDQKQLRAIEVEISKEADELNYISEQQQEISVKDILEVIFVQDKNCILVLTQTYYDMYDADSLQLLKRSSPFLIPVSTWSFTMDFQFLAISDHKRFYIMEIESSDVIANVTNQYPCGLFFLLEPDKLLVNIEGIEFQILKAEKFTEGKMPIQQPTSVLNKEGVLYIGNKQGQVIEYNCNNQNINIHQIDDSPIRKILEHNENIYIVTQSGKICQKSKDSYTLYKSEAPDLQDLHFTRNGLVTIYPQQVITSLAQNIIQSAYYTCSILLSEGQTLICGKSNGALDILSLQKNTIYEIWVTKEPINKLINTNEYVICSSGKCLYFLGINSLEREIVIEIGYNISDLAVTQNNTSQYLVGIGLDQLFYISPTDKVVLARVQFDYPLYHLIAYGHFIYILSYSRIDHHENWLLSNKINISTEPSQIAILKQNLQDLAKFQKHAKVDNKVINVVIFPHLLTLSHFIAYYGVQQQIPSYAYQITSSEGVNPVLIASIKHNKEIAQQMIKITSKDLTPQKLVDLNAIGYDEIIAIYESLYINKSVEYYYEFVSTNQKLPIIIQSDKADLNMNTFMSHIQFQGEGTNVVFYQSTIKLPLETGSSLSIEFLESLQNCPVQDVFRTNLVNNLIRYKWEKVKLSIFIQFTIYFAMILSIISVVVFKDDFITILIMFIMNFLQIMYEILQMAVMRAKYWSDFMNYLDIVRCLCIIFYSVGTYLNIPSYLLEKALCAIVIIGFYRGIDQMRIFSNMRYLINMIKQVLVDMGAFFIILVYMVITFALVEMSLPSYFEREHIIEYFTDSYLILMGEFNNKPTQEQGWIFFALFTIVNTIVLLNLLISVIGDTYDKVQSQMLVVSQLEMIEMIIEAEYIFFWNRNNNKLSYLQGCCAKGQENAVDNMWEGKVREILNKIDRLAPKTSDEEISLPDTINQIVTEAVAKSELELKQQLSDQQSKFESLLNNINSKLHELNNIKANLSMLMARR